jgi:hypothetical protein
MKSGLRQKYERGKYTLKTGGLRPFVKRGLEFIAGYNLSVLRAAAKIDSKLCGEGRYLKILWWKSWKKKHLL